jgi:hypothetical protein
MKFLFHVAVIVFSFELAHSQINSGSLIVFQVVDGKFIMAADSREVLNGIPNDSNCKIAAFSDQLLFGATGVPRITSFPPDIFSDWDALEELKKVVNTTTFINTVDAATKVATIADKWARALQFDWRVLYVIHPKNVEDIARHQRGNLINGIFAVSVGDHVALTVRSIILSNKVPTIDRPDVFQCGVLPCAAGITDIVTEYVHRTSQRANQETWSASPILLQRAIPEMLKVIRLVDLTIAFDPTGFVGGHIDAVELDYDGSIKWFQRPDCPETYDQNEQH